jgi:hypothetical protein
MNQELINDKLQELKNKAISKEERIYHYMWREFFLSNWHSWF